MLVDDARAVEPLAQAAQHVGVTIDTYVEVDVGAGPLRRGAGRARGEARTARRRREGTALRRAALLPRRGAAPALARGATRSDRGGRRALDDVEARRRARGRRRADHHRRGHRHVGARARVGRVERDPGRLVHLHGCRLRAQYAGRRRAPLRAQPVRARRGHERAHADSRDLRRGTESVLVRLRIAGGARAVGRDLPEGFRRARGAGSRGECVGAGAWRAVAAGAGALRSRSESLRLDRGVSALEGRGRMARGGAGGAGVGRSIGHG